MNRPVALHALLAGVGLILVLAGLCLWPAVAANLFAADGVVGERACRLIGWVQVGSSGAGLALLGLAWVVRCRQISSWLRIGQLMAVCLVFSLCFGLAETALRVGNFVRFGLILHSAIPSQPPLTEHGDLRFLQPGYYDVPVRNDLENRISRVAVTISSLGIKSNPAMALPEGYRILCLGGSTTYGWNLTNEQSYPRQLEFVFRERFGDPVEVINAGVPAYTANQVTQSLKRRWVDFNPDMVVYYGGYNDVWRGYAVQFGVEKPRSSSGESHSKIPLLLGPMQKGPPRISFVALAVANPMAQLLANQPPPGYSRNPQLGNRKPVVLGADQFERIRGDLEELASFCKSRRIKLVIARFASCWNHADRPAEAVRWARAAADMPWVTPESVFESLQLVRELFSEVASAHGLICLTPDQKMPNRAEYFFDTIHLSASGARVLAEEIYSGVVKQVRNSVAEGR